MERPKLTYRHKLPRLEDALKLVTCPLIHLPEPISPHRSRARVNYLPLGRAARGWRRGFVLRPYFKSPPKLRIIPSRAFATRKTRSRSEGRMEVSLISLPRPNPLSSVVSPTARKHSELLLPRPKPTRTAKVSPIRRPASPERSERSSVGPWEAR
jgi:hypothetical protein